MRQPAMREHAGDQRGRRGDLEALDESRDAVNKAMVALDEAKEELDLAYDVAEDTLLEAREARDPVACSN